MSITHQSKTRHRPEFYFIILFFLNLILFIDRGIIPGSSNEFNEFIFISMKSSSPDFYLGILQSTFIVGLSFSSLVFGNLVHCYSPFTLISIGLAMWILAVFLCGISFYCDSFPMLVVGRMLSGVGEASFQCCVPPWIEANSNPKKRAIWLSIFYTAMPVGTAFGYAYSALITEAIGWPFAYFIVGALAVPFVIFLSSIASRFPVGVCTSASIFKDMDSVDSSETEEVVFTLVKAGMDSSDGGSVGMATPPKWAVAQSSTSKAPTDSDRPSLLEEFCIVVNVPLFLLLSAGYAAQTASIIGLATFGSSFAMGLGLFDSEAGASTAFGAVISVAGLVGTPLGGILLDRKPPLTSQSAEHVRSAAAHVSFFTLVGAVLLMCASCVTNKTVFLSLVCAGSACIFSTTTGVCMAVMRAVPQQQSAFAMALLTVVIHLLGDVPSPVLVGLLKDALAPGCIVSAVSDQCRADGLGQRLTFALTTAWMGWACLYYFVAWRVAVRTCKHSPALLLDDAWLADNHRLKENLIDRT